MYRNQRWFFTALSISTAGMLIVAPVAWADDDKKSDDHGGRATTTTQVKSEDRGDDHAEHAAAPAVKVEHENDAVEHANEAAEKAAEQANEVAERANEAAVKAAERAAEAAREAAEEAAEPAEAVPTTFAGASLLAHLNNEAAELNALTAMTSAADVDDEDVGEVEEVEVENEAVDNVEVVNLSALGGTTAITNAAMADAPLVSAFFTANSPAAMAIRNQLAAINVTDLSKVLAILHAREHSVLVILNQ
jgi:flagellar biosynthesis GTPase FlhF